MFFNNSFYISSHRTATNFLIWTSSLFYFFRLFYLSTRFNSVLTLKSSTIHWLTCFRVSSGLFLVLFWIFWMLVTVHKLCHVTHTSRITTCGKKFFGVLAVRSEKITRRKKKTRMAIAKFFALNANAIMLKEFRTLLRNLKFLGNVSTYQYI